MNVQDYLKLPYSIVLRHVQDESSTYFIATVQELSGCMSRGSTVDEAYKSIQEAMESWIKETLESGQPVPVPFDSEKFSGKFVIRLPKSLHAHLACEAEKEGVSLNQYALYKLSR